MLFFLYHLTKVSYLCSYVDSERVILSAKQKSLRINLNQGIYGTFAEIGAGQEVRIRVIAKAETAGHHRFRTEVRAGDTVLVAEEATHYMSPTSDRVSRHSNEGSNR